MTATTGPGNGDPQGSDPNRTSLPRRAALRTINQLQGGYRQDVPAAVAAVARLRREAGREPHSSPGSWGLDDLATLAELRDQERQEEEQRREGSPAAPRFLSTKARAREEEREEREDRAVHLAVTLWALHQQSLRDEPMHKLGWPLGRAVRRLAHDKTGTNDHDSSDDDGPGTARQGEGDEAVEEARETVRKRFVRIGTSTDFDTLSGRLREMILLLRRAQIPLDYGQLAEQLFHWQDESRQANVRRAWGREFHHSFRKRTKPSAEDDGTPPGERGQQDFTDGDTGD